MLVSFFGSIVAMSRTRFRQSRARDGENLAADDEVQTGRNLRFVTRGCLGDREACQNQGRGERWKQHCGSFFSEVSGREVRPGRKNVASLELGESKYLPSYPPPSHRNISRPRRHRDDDSHAASIIPLSTWLLLAPVPSAGLNGPRLGTAAGQFSEYRARACRFSRALARSGCLDGNLQNARPAAS